MNDIFKMIMGFAAIVFIGLASVTVLKVMKSGDVQASVSTVDSASVTR